MHTHRTHSLFHFMGTNYQQGGLLAMGVKRNEFDRAKAQKHMPAAWIDVRGLSSLVSCVM